MLLCVAGETALSAEKCRSRPTLGRVSSANSAYFSARQAAVLVGVSERTVRNWLASGRLSADKSAAGFRIPRDAVEHLVAERRAESANGTEVDRAESAESSGNGRGPSAESTSEHAGEYAESPALVELVRAWSASSKRKTVSWLAASAGSRPNLTTPEHCRPHSRRSPSRTRQDVILTLLAPPKRRLPHPRRAGPGGTSGAPNGHTNT